MTGTHANQILPGRPKPDLAFARRALDLWNIRAEIDCVTDLGGSYNANLRVQAADADVVLRVRPEWARPDRLRDVHRLMRILHENNLLTALPLESRNGNTFEEVDGHIVEVYHYLPEEGNREWSMARWRSGFEHMGRLHSILSAMPDEITPPLVSNYAPLPLAETMLADTVECLEALPVSRNTKEALAICAEARDILEIIGRYWRDVQPRLQAQIVHGDFRLDNLLFDASGRVAYTLDFDFMAWRERIFELAYAMRFALPQLTANSNGILDVTAIREWLDAYDQSASSPLSDLERQALPYQFAMVALYYVGRSCRRKTPLWGVLRETSYVELARFLVERPEAIVPA